MDFNGKWLCLFGYVFYELQVGEQYNENARILVERKRTSSITGSVLLATLRSKFEPVIEDELDVNSIEKKTKNSA